MNISSSASGSPGPCLLAPSADVSVLDGTLKASFEADASQHVRLHAFEAYFANG